MFSMHSWCPHYFQTTWHNCMFKDTHTHTQLYTHTHVSTRGSWTTWGSRRSEGWSLVGMRDTKREERVLIRISPRLESETLQSTFPAKLNTVPIFPISLSVALSYWLTFFLSQAPNGKRWIHFICWRGVGPWRNCWQIAVWCHARVCALLGLYSEFKNHESSN